MRIVVKPDDGKKLKILLPTGLILNRFTAALAPKYLKEQNIHITKKQAVSFVKALNCYRRKHPEWVLVEVQSADGEYVKIKI